MVDRQEIPAKIKLAAFKRAGGPENVTCEGCRMPLRGKPFQYDHIIEEWEQNLPKAERPPITLEDVKLLGQSCCHEPKTSRKAGERAHGVRIVKGLAKAGKPKGRPMDGSRGSRYRKRMDGTVERRD